MFKDEVKLGISTTTVYCSPNVDKENFYFLFGDYLSPLKNKMLNETNIRHGTEGRYSILYKEYRIFYFICLDHEEIMILGWHKLSVEEYVFMRFR